MRRGLTEAHRQILAELARDPRIGRLTGNLADKLRHGPDRYKGVGWAARRCHTLARHGLVQRDSQNNQRWHITEAGRAVLAMQEGTDGC